MSHLRGTASRLTVDRHANKSEGPGDGKWRIENGKGDFRTASARLTAPLLLQFSKTRSQLVAQAASTRRRHGVERTVSVVTRQMAVWGGDFGRAYTDRNTDTDGNTHFNCDTDTDRNMDTNRNTDADNNTYPN